jgi:hypothetical protein
LIEEILATITIFLCPSFSSKFCFKGSHCLLFLQQTYLVFFSQQSHIQNNKESSTEKHESISDAPSRTSLFDLPPFQLLQRILYIVSDIMNVSSIMVKTVAALVVVAALISTRFSSEVGGVSVDGTLIIILNPLPLFG